MIDKYVRMMESTAPLEYEEIKNLLVEIDSDSQKYIEKIIPIFLEWEKEFRLEYPYLSTISRPAFSSQDSLSSTSLETYLKAELSTYSSNTLQLYYNFIKKIADKKINLSRKIQSNIVTKYGFNSLQEANDLIKRKVER